jgi:hypothetical protein
MLVLRKHRIVTLGLAVMLIASTILAIGVFAYPRPTMAQAVCKDGGNFCISDPGCAILYSWSKRYDCFDAVNGPWSYYVRIFCNCPS